MGRTKGAKDKNPQKRKSMTEKQKRERNEKKRREESAAAKAAKANFVSRLQGPMGATTAGMTTAGITTAGMTMAGPMTAGITMAGPTMAGPTTAGPTTAGPTTAGPTTARPTTAGPTMAGPMTMGPTMAGPTTMGTTAAETRTVETREVGTRTEGTATPVTATTPTTTRLVPPSADPSEESEQNAVLQPDDTYFEIVSPECNGIDNLGEIVAILDDAHEHENENNGPSTAIMKEYMKAIMKRYQIEDSPSFQQKEQHGHVWLKEYLKNHDFWIRSDCCKWMCRRLGITCYEKAYYHDVLVWFPDEIDGSGTCMPSCPNCKRNDHVRKHSYPLDHPGRRVVTFDSHYYIMSRQYLCTLCKDEHKKRESAANGQSFQRVQYTMMGTHKEVLKQLPDELLYLFPAVLSHRAGLDKCLARSLRPLFDKGLRPDGVSSVLLELHSLRYTDANILYEVRLARDRQFSPGLVRPMFSKFDDPKLYNGGVPFVTTSEIRCTVLHCGGQWGAMDK